MIILMITSLYKSFFFFSNRIDKLYTFICCLQFSQRSSHPLCDMPDAVLLRNKNRLTIRGHLCNFSIAFAVSIPHKWYITEFVLLKWSAIQATCSLCFHRLQKSYDKFMSFQYSKFPIYCQGHYKQQGHSTMTPTIVLIFTKMSLAKEHC